MFIGQNFSGILIVSLKNDIAGLSTTAYTQLTGFVARGPRASQCLTLSKNVESS